MSRGPRRAVTVFAVVMLCLLAAVAGAPATPAQTTVDPDDVVLSFSRIDATPSAAGEVTLVVEVTNATAAPLTDVTGTLTVGPPVASRLALHGALGAPGAAGGGPAAAPAVPSRDVRGRAERAGPDVPPGSSRLLVLETSLDELGLPAAGDRPAVYPVQVTVRGGGGEVGRLATALVDVGERVASPLRAGTIVRVDADPDGRPLAGDQLERLAAALTAADVPVTIALDNALAAAVPGVEEVAAMLDRPGIERVLVPFADADLVALHQGSLTGLARRALELGAAAWPGTTAAAGAAVIAPGAAVDGATVVDILDPFGMEALVVGEEHLVIADGRALPTSPGPVRRLLVDTPAADRLQALVPDPWLDELLGAGPLDVAMVQRVLAETAVIHLERPGAQVTRGVLLRVPGATQPAGIEALLTALAAVPWTEPVGVDELRTTVAVDGTARLDDVAAEAAALPEAYVADLAATQESLTALQGVLTEGRDGVAELRDDLLLAASADFRDAPAAGRRLMEDVRDTAADILGAVAVVGEPTITFTDSVGQLPVVLANTAPVPLRVRVRLSSRRLSFPSDDIDVELGADTTTTVLVDTEARTPGGTAPVDVVVTDPTATRQLATGTLVVRIAAYPLLALVLVASSALLLVLWWVRDVRRRRRVPAGAG